jgi:hypothetical protein
VKQHKCEVQASRCSSAVVVRVVLVFQFNSSVAAVLLWFICAAELF